MFSTGGARRLDRPGPAHYAWLILTHRRRSPLVAVWLLAGLAAFSPRPALAADPPLYRIFLLDGSAVACFGEYTRVDQRVVFSIPLGDGPSPELQLTSIPVDRVDWPRTERYAQTVRAVHYIQTRGEEDFALLSGQIARALNEIALTENPRQKLALAVAARRRLSEWPRDHYGYRSADVAQITTLIDEAINELRAAAGEQAFDLNLVANVEAPTPTALLPEPGVAERAEQALRVAELADQPAERLSLLEAIEASLGRTSASDPRRLDAVRERVARRIGEERAIDQQYLQLSREVVASAASRARRADVRGIQRLVARVRSRDEKMGQRRPAQIGALLATVQQQLDAARRLELARQHWAVKSAIYREYRDAIAGPSRRLERMGPGLGDIKALAGPTAEELGQLAAQATRAAREVRAIIVPPDVAQVHGLFVSAVQLAVQAVDGRRDAVNTGEMTKAWSASSAAAGSLMLYTRAREDLAALLSPPQLQ